jgi:hypothetical protein
MRDRERVCVRQRERVTQKYLEVAVESVLEKQRNIQSKRDREENNSTSHIYITKTYFEQEIEPLELIVLEELVRETKVMNEKDDQ